jgi:dolichol-phosphate mannosyltransferase
VSLTALARPRSPAGWVVLGARLAAASAMATRLARAARPGPRLSARDLPPPSAALETISVVVPARDEEARLGPCLAALARARGVDEVIVVDDRSTDGTAAVASAHGARVLPGRPLPPGWAGKAWALQQGLQEASGTWVVMLDADTRPDPDLPAALVARLLAGGFDLASVAGRFDCPTRGLRWLHPALLTTLVVRFGPPSGWARAPRRLLANGQCTGAHRARLLGDGGLAPVRGHLVEDVALARALAERGRKVALLDGTSMLTVRMYENGVEAWRGWGRSLALPGVEPRHRQVLDALTVWLAQALPLPRLLAGRADLLDLLLLSLRAGTLAGTARAYTRTGPAYWASPLADGLAAVRLTISILRPSRTWRGRTYPP